MKKNLTPAETQQVRNSKFYTMWNPKDPKGGELKHMLFLATTYPPPTGTSVDTVYNVLVTAVSCIGGAQLFLDDKTKEHEAEIADLKLEVELWKKRAERMQFNHTTTLDLADMSLDRARAESLGDPEAVAHIDSEAQALIEDSDFIPSLLDALLER